MLEGTTMVLLEKHRASDGNIFSIEERTVVGLAAVERFIRVTVRNFIFYARNFERNRIALRVA